MSLTFSNVNKASLSDYTIFARTEGIRAAYLPDDSLWLPICYNAGLAKANMDILSAGMPALYSMAVYNYGLHLQIQITPDQDGSTYFRDLRNDFGLSRFVPGVISGSGDSGTSGSVLVPDALKNITLGDLQLLKTPYGRAYLAFAQDYGPTIWGLS